MWKFGCYVVAMASEAAAALLYFEHIFERKTAKRTLILSFVLGYVLVLAVSQLNSVLANTITYVLVNVVLLFLNFKCKKWIGLIQICYVTFVMGGTEVLTSLILSLFSYDFDTYLQNLTVMIALTAISRLLFFVVLQITARFIKPMKGRMDGGMIVLLAVLPAVSVLIIMTTIYVGMAAPIKPLTGMLMTVSTLALLGVNIVVTVIYNHLQKMYDEHLELELIAQKAQINTENYELLEEQYARQRILIHDIRRHLQVMRGLLEAQKYGELEQYFAQMEQNPALQKVVRLCDHPVLNVILIHHAAVCKSLGLDASFDIRQHTVDFMSAQDITAIFDNLLTNAEEAAKDTEEKYVALSVLPQGENGLLITLINSCAEPPETDKNGQIRTHKKDKTRHGIGLKSIEQAAQHYGGLSQMYYSEADRCLHFILHLQVPE